MIYSREKNTNVLLLFIFINGVLMSHMIDSEKGIYIQIVTYYFKFTFKIKILIIAILNTNV